MVRPGSSRGSVRDVWRRSPNPVVRGDYRGNQNTVEVFMAVKCVYLQLTMAASLEFDLPGSPKYANPVDTVKRVDFITQWATYHLRRIREIRPTCHRSRKG